MFTDIVFVKTNNPDEVGLRVINDEGATMSLWGPAIDHHVVARGERTAVFHRIDVAYWDEDAMGLHQLPISSAEEIVEALARHLGYKLVKG